MNLKVTLNWAYIKNEIDYETYKAAEITITDDPVVKGEAQSDNTNADADFCRAKIDSAVATIEEIMHKHYLTTSLEEADNNLVRNRQSWVLNLFYSDSERRVINLESLTAHCHRYVVDYVLAEWCKLALPTLTEGYLVRMQSEEQSIGLLINRKEAPTLFDEDQDDTIDTTVEGFSAKVTSVETGEAGSDADVNVVVERTAAPDGSMVPTLNFTFKIPQGIQGIQGVKGDTGKDGLRGIQGDAGEVNYDDIYSHCDTYINATKSTAEQELSAEIEAKAAALDTKYDAFTTSINSTVSTQDAKISSAETLIANIKSFLNYDVNQPKYGTINTMITTVAQGLIDSQSGSFGTKVSWGTEDTTSVYLNVGGTEKKMLLYADYLLTSYFNKLFVPVNSSGEEVAITSDSIYAIKAKYSLFSVGALTAYKLGTDSQTGGDTVKWTQLVTSGTRIATIQINSADPIDVYAPTSGSSASSWTDISGRPTWLDNYISAAPDLSFFDNSTTQYITASSLITKFSQLTDVPAPATADLVWGVKSVTDNVPEYGWLARSGGGTGGTVVSWGTVSTNYASLVVDGTSKDISLDGHTHTQYLTSSALDGYALESWVENKGYITSSALTGYVQTDDLSSASVSYATTAGTASKLNSHTIWGQVFTGDNDITGSMTGVTKINDVLDFSDSSYGVKVSGETYFGNDIVIERGVGRFDIEPTYDGDATSYNYIKSIYNNAASRNMMITGYQGNYIPELVLGATKTKACGTLQIGDALLSYDSTNHILLLQDGTTNGNMINFVTTGALTSYGILSNAEIGSVTSLSVETKLTTPKISHPTTGNSVNFEGCGISLDGGIYAASAIESATNIQAIGTLIGANLQIGTDNTIITDVHVDTDNLRLYLTVGSTQYYASLTQV